MHRCEHAIAHETITEECSRLERDKRLLEKELKEERRKSSRIVMDLFFALRHIKGKPTLKDLVKLAKRIKQCGSNAPRASSQGEGK